MKSDSFTPGRVFILLLCVVILVYGNTFLNEWTYDDIPVVLNNPDAHSLAGFIQNSYSGRPLRELTHIPEYMLFGANPAGYRIQQLGWHATNGFLLFILMRRIGLSAVAAIVGAILFLVHPLQVESVASIGHRKELLALFFSLASLLAYLKATLCSNGRRLALLALSGLLYVAALFSNVTSVMVPILAVLFDMLLLNQEKRLLMRRPVVSLPLLGVAGAVFLYGVRGHISLDNLLILYSQNGFFGSTEYYPLLLASVKAFGFYVSKLICPVGLAPEYSLVIPTRMTDAGFLVSAALLAGVIAVLAYAWKRAPVAAFGIGWFLACYIPVSNLIPTGYIAADRYMYLCLPGIAMVVGDLFRRLSARWCVGLCLSVLVVLAATSVIQNGYWRNTLTLWSHAAEVNERSTGAQYCAATAYLKVGNLPMAEMHARRVMELNRFFLPAYLLMGKIEEQQRKYGEALKHYNFFLSYGAMQYPAEANEVRRKLVTLPAEGELP